LKLYDYQTGEILQELEPIHSWVKFLYLNEAETKLALHLQTNVPNKAPNDGIRILDLDSKEILWDIQWNVPTNPFERTPKTDDWDDYGFTKDFYLWQNGEILAQHGFDLYTASWHFQSEDPYFVMPSGALMNGAQIVVTSNHNLPYSYQKEIVQFWSAKTGNLLGEIRTYYRIRDIAFSPDGYLIAVSGDDGLIRIWGVKKES
jgi:WD40 repeat protein